MYLQPLFSSEDIAKHLPHESRTFESVDALWRKTMMTACGTKVVMRVCKAPSLITK